MASTLQDTITIKFEAKDQGLLNAIKSLDSATKSLLNSQAKLVDKERKSETTREKHKKQIASLIVGVKALGGQWSKNSTIMNLHKKALKGDRIAMEKLRIATSKYVLKLKQTKRGLLDTSHSTRILGGSLAVLRSKLLIASFGLTVLGATLGKLVSLYGKQEKAERKLKQALKSTGHSAGLTHKQLLLMASGLQSITTHGDEAVIEAQSLMLTFTNINKDVFPQALESILNVSDAMGQDLKQSTIQIGKALNDPIQGMSALRRIGIQLSDTQKKQVKDFIAVNDVASAQKIIIKELDTQFGGMARAIRLTLSGSIIALSNSWGDMMEEMGEKLAPFISGLALALESVTSIMQSEGEKQLDFLRKIGASEETIKLATIRLLKEEAQERLKSIQSTDLDLNKTDKLNESYQEQQLILVAMRDNLADKEKALSNSTTALMDATASSQEFNKALADGERATVSFTEKTITSGFGLGGTIVALTDKKVALGENLALDKESVEVQKEQIANQIEFNLALRDYLISLGLIPNLIGTSNSAMIAQIKYATIAKSALGALGDAIVPGADVGDSLRKFVANYLTLIQSVILASGAMSGAVSMAWIPGLGVAQAVAALVALEAAKAGVRSIQFAETGFDGIVNQPTMFMTGEAGAERVSVTPLQGPNINGPSGITLNISAPLIDEHILDVILPSIKKAQRMNLA